MKELRDTQNEHDSRHISIDRVGVRGIHFPIVVSDKEKRTQSTVATIAMMVDLPQQYKGTHMSRFIEALHEHRHFLDVHTAVHLPERLLKKLSAQRAHVEIDFPFFRVKKAPVTHMPGMMNYDVRFEIDAERDPRAHHHTLPLFQGYERTRRAQSAQHCHVLRALCRRTCMD